MDDSEAESPDLREALREAISDPDIVHPAPDPPCLPPKQSIDESPQIITADGPLSLDQQPPQTAANDQQPKQPRQKQQVYSYHHADSAPTVDELEEFFSYTEIPGLVADGKDAFSRGWQSVSPETDWTDASEHTKQNFVSSLLEQLEHRDAELRFEAARRLAYIAQGTPCYSTSEEDHLRLVLQNCTILRNCGTLTSVYDALRSAGGRWNIVSDSTLIDDPNTSADWPQLEERQEFLEELNAEMSLYLHILYFMVEIFKGDETWGEDLMTLNPPLPIYAFCLVAGLREKNAKGYPVKKLLLFLWKLLLSCLGGQKDIQKVKALVRDIEGLTPDPPTTANAKVVTKVHPTDFANFRTEITTKYPTFNPPDITRPITDISLGQIAAASAPQPLRPLYPYTHDSSTSRSHHNYGPAAPPPAPLPPTPAVTPPQSPQAKPKKQQFQTDQSRPFILPVSAATFGRNKSTSYYVPRSIDEAGRLFFSNFRISTDLWQTVKLREECIADESGTSQAEADLVKYSKAVDRTDSIHARMADLKLEQGEDSVESQADPLEMLFDLERKVEIERNSNTDEKTAQLLTQKIYNIKRLQRIEIIYRAILPHMQSAVIVLLKLLLATVTPNNLSSGLGNSGEDDTVPQLNLEETDIMRHREITSKSVSAIIILILRWLKVSHIMKFQYFGQLLVDSNCLLLILKIFGLHEASTQVRIRPQVDELNFFRYCHLVASRNPEFQEADSLLATIVPRSHESLPEIKISPDARLDDEVEMVHEYSSRNFFAFINFVHTLQKLTKRKIHRVLLLVQYKSSAILKRLLKVSHPLLQLYTLKIIKSQIPYCGRKWRQSNMKVITLVYLNCRPDLRDDWLTTADVDGDVEDSLPHEQALRVLVKFFNEKHYRSFAPNLHRRTSSQTAPPDHGSHGDLIQGPPTSPFNMAHGEDSFPPTRSMTSFGLEPAFRSSYIPNVLMDAHYFTEDYEQLLGDLLTPRYSVDANGVPSLYPDGSGEQIRSAWSRLGEILGDSEVISDSESVASLGQLYDDNSSDLDDADSQHRTETRPGWSEMSPEIIMALEEERDHNLHGSPRSPRPRRGSTESKSPALRPVLTSIDADDDVFDAYDDVDERGPAESAPHTGPAVDEVEAVFGE